MHIERIEIENIAGIRELTWEAPPEPAGWHVIIGDNGSGKSSLLRAVALALVGPDQAPGLRQDWDNWLRRGTLHGRVTLSLRPDPEFDPVPAPATGNDATVELHREPDVVQLRQGWVDHAAAVWGQRRGWFSAAYGPFRRFSGGDPTTEGLGTSYPSLARHLTVFGEAYALTEAPLWLRELNYRMLEDEREGRLFDALVDFVNQDGFLPHGYRLDNVSSAGVHFVDASGVELPVELLSDGFRSVLSMTFEIIRQLSMAYEHDSLFDAEHLRIEAPGVVLIDEVDVHLHPSWQREIGVWLRKHFPRMQFIVTTHSPLVLQAAEVGSVMRLPSAGSEEEPKMLAGDELQRVVYGDVVDAYGTGVFGHGMTRSDTSKARLERLAALNVKQLEQPLSPEEHEELQELRATMPTAVDTGL
jgi:energy-coupling factor transporter ATP-binding protein EcfA2